jgi:hypothetical protein
VRVAGDDELLPAVRLYLQPVARATTLGVPGVESLGHDALELLLLGRLVEGIAVVECLGEAHTVVAPVEQLRKSLLALAQREVDQRHTLQFEQVEDVVDERRAALLHRGEARATTLVERAHLAVQHRVRRLHRLRDLLRDVREALGEVVVPAREELDLGAAEVRERAVAVPFDLEDPLLAVRHVALERGEHRPVPAAL